MRQIWHPSARLLGLIAVLSAAMLAPAAFAQSVAELTRIKGQGKSTLRGIGLVVGLNGTGDAGKELAVARPLAEVLRQHANPVAELDELKNGKSVALVMVTATIDEGGARVDDQIDAHVSVLHSATSLANGRLYLTALMGPLPGQPVFAMAEGPIELEGSSVRTGRVRHGARMVRDVVTGKIQGESFELIIEPSFAGFESATAIAGAITQMFYGRTGEDLRGMPPLATAVDDRTIRVDIPAQEREDSTAFVADVLSTEVKAALLKLPPTVMYNERSGMIVLTGDVRISPVAVTHRSLTITTTNPPPVPTPQNPLLETSRMVGVQTGAKDSELSRLADVLGAFKQLNVPVDVQIGFLEMLHKTGRLHARLVRED